MIFPFLKVRYWSSLISSHCCLFSLLVCKYFFIYWGASMLGVCMHSCMLCHFSRVWLFATLWTIGHQAPLSMGFSSQEYQGVLPCLPPGNLLNLGMEPASLTSYALAAGFFTSSTTWKALCWVYKYLHTSTWTGHRYIWVLPILNTYPNSLSTPSL